jgi:hypothetical protein
MLIRPPAEARKTLMIVRWIVVGVDLPTGAQTGPFAPSTPVGASDRG